MRIAADDRTRDRFIFLVSMERRTMYRVSNPHLDALSKDNLYHLGLSTEDDLQRLFGDVKVRGRGFLLFLLRALLDSVVCLSRRQRISYGRPVGVSARKTGDSASGRWKTDEFVSNRSLRSLQSRSRHCGERETSARA